MSATQTESLPNITTSIIIPTSPTKSPFRAMTSKSCISLVGTPRKSKIIDDGADSDCEIIEANITVIDLDETSNDVLNIQSAVEINQEQIVPERIVSVSEPAGGNSISLSPSTVLDHSDGLVMVPPPAALTYDQVTSSASSTPLNIRQTQSLPVASIEQPLTTEKTPVTSHELITETRETVLPQVLVIDESPDPAPRSLFFCDIRGALPDSAFLIPLYDPISDDSFCSNMSVTPVRNQSNMPTIDLDDISFDSHVMPSPKLSKRKRKADDSVIFVSETLRSGAGKTQAANFIPVPDWVNLLFLSRFTNLNLNIFFLSSEAYIKAT